MNRNIKHPRGAIQRRLWGKIQRMGQGQSLPMPRGDDKRAERRAVKSLAAKGLVTIEGKRFHLAIDAPRIPVPLRWGGGL